MRAGDRRAVLGRVFGLSIGHVSPEAAEGGTIGLVEQGDLIRIDIPNRKIELVVDDATLAARRATRDAEGWKPAKPRKRKITTSPARLCGDDHQRGKGRRPVIPE